MGKEAAIEASIPADNLKIIQQLNHFAVENIKDARRFLVRCNLKFKIDESEFFELNKDSGHQEISQLISILNKGNSIGIISDAGCPGIADPGAKLVEAAHINNIEVIPLVGPSSILLALIASGFNGQSFAFHGYLPRSEEERAKRLLQMENSSRKEHQTQIFMETPYRNEVLFEDVLKHLSSKTQIGVAADLTLPSQYIKSQTIEKWKKETRPSLHKRPAIFLLLA